MKPSINLSTRTYINRRALKSGVLAAIAALVVWIIAGSYLLVQETSHLSSVQSKISELKAQRSELRGQDGEQVNSAKLEKRWKEVAFINSLLERDSFRWTELMDKLEEQAFSGIVIKSIDPDFKDKTLALSGYARELKHLRRFIDNLILSEEFSEVYLLKQSQQKLKDRDGRERMAIAFDLSLVQGI